MSTAARWSLRLARSSVNPVKSRLSTRGAVKRIEQRRWLQQRPSAPPPQARRPWAQRRQEPLPDETESKQRQQHSSISPEQPPPPSEQPSLSTTLASSPQPDLLAPVSLPDDPHTVLPPHHPALAILGNSSLVIQRQLEMINLMLGFEQANRYTIMDGQGTTLGYMAEMDQGMGSALKRQAFKTHRSFVTHVFDRAGREVLRVQRPFAWISSRIRVYDAVPPKGYGDEGEGGTGLVELGGKDVTANTEGLRLSPLKLEEMRVIGEAQQQWAPLRRKYNLFAFRPFEEEGEGGMTTLDSGQRLLQGNQRGGDLSVTEAGTGDAAIERGMVQFAGVNEPFLSWDFNLRDRHDGLVGSVNRNFSGFAREIFTDTGVYALRMDSAAQQGSIQDAAGKDVQSYEREATAMSLDQRAVMLATAVSIDFDYFSRHSGHAAGGGFMPFFWPVGGAGAEAGGAGTAGAGAGAAGAGAEAGAIGAAGAAEGATAGAVGAAGRGAAGMGGAAESGMVGAGTMAGYEAMQRGVYGGGGRADGVDDASPQAAPPPQPNDPYAEGGAAQGGESQPGNEVWGEDSDPWGWTGTGGGSEPPPGAGGAGGGGGEGGGGGWMDSISDFFGE